MRRQCNGLRWAVPPDNHRKARPTKVKETIAGADAGAEVDVVARWNP